MGGSETKPQPPPTYVYQRPAYLQRAFNRHEEEQRYLARPDAYENLIRRQNAEPWDAVLERQRERRANLDL